jgi:hypothetical protein
MLTPWGYSVDALPPIIDAGTFNEMTGNRYAGDGRIESAIAAATAAIRAYCGWHVAPILTCEYVCDGEPGDIWLPCAGLRSVGSVEFDGVAQAVRGFNRHGRVRTASRQPIGGLGNVSVTYSAGFDLDATPDLARLVAQRVVAEVALGAYGVASESAGGVSVSYSGTALSDSGSAFLPDSVKAALSAYRLVSAHVA